MKLSFVKDEMSNLLENLNEQFDLINSHENQIPQIEVDIFMRNIQKMYENTIHLNKLNSTFTKIEEEAPEAQVDNDVKQAESIEQETPITPEVSHTVETPEEPINTEIEAEIKVTKNIAEPIAIAGQVEVEQVIEPEIMVVEDAIAEVNKSEIKKEVTLVEEKVEEEPKAEIKAEKTGEEPVLPFEDLLEEEKTEVDLFTEIKVNDEITDLNKKLAEARNTQSIVEKLQNKRIESLKSVIGINDKFYFINELFSGNSQKYEDIIYTLNNFKKLEDAMVYFSTLKYKFGWNEESDAYLRLTQMLERKFELTNA